MCVCACVCVCVCLHVCVLLYIMWYTQLAVSVWEGLHYPQFYQQSVLHGQVVLILLHRHMHTVTATGRRRGEDRVMEDREEERGGRKGREGGGKIKIGNYFAQQKFAAI